MTPAPNPPAVAGRLPPRPESRLYGQALALLTDGERQALLDFVAWLDQHPGIPKSAVDGARIRGNFCAESHLVGGGPFGDPTELVAFLRRCVTRFTGTTTLEERHACYEDACEEFLKRGLRISRHHLPDRLLRYVTSRALLARLAQRMLGRAARAAGSDDIRALVMSFPRLQARWSSSRLTAGERLGRGGAVFATFDQGAGAPRHDPVALSQALALPFWGRPRAGDEILVELTYRTDDVADHRFPTVADAGWGHLFSPASETAPDDAAPDTCCGWTAPLQGHAQPEIVHANASLHVLDSPPRLVGVVPA